MLDPYDQGWADGTEDIGRYTPRWEDYGYTGEDKLDYLEGYRDAQRGWD